METITKLNDPALAKAYFDSKLAFTTGPVELNRMIQGHDSNIVVVDVRAADDFAKGHIPEAISLPQGKWSTLEGLRRDKLNIVYCYSQTCHLAAKAAAEFASKGYPVMEMEGGFESWKGHDLGIEHEPINRLKRAASLFHWRT